MDISKIEALNKYISEMSAEIVAYVSQSSILAMRNRITKGKALDGSPFQPYSTKPSYIDSIYVGKTQFYPGGYAQYKQTTNPNWLEMTGGMLNSIIFKKLSTTTGSIISATDEEEEKIKGNDKIRPFWGINEDESAMISDGLVGKIEKEIKHVISNN